MRKPRGTKRFPSSSHQHGNKNVAPVIVDGFAGRFDHFLWDIAALDGARYAHAVAHAKKQRNADPVSAESV